MEPASLTLVGLGAGFLLAAVGAWIALAVVVAALGVAMGAWIALRKEACDE